MLGSKLESIDKIRFENLTLSFEDGPCVFKEITFELPVGKVIWVRSPSGQGKSSFLKILAGLILPTEGQYFVNDKDVADMDFSEFVPYRLNIGYSFDFGGLLTNRTIYENLMLPLAYHSLLHPDEAHRRVADTLNRFYLGEAQNKRPAAIAGGMRKAACVARAFVLEPELLLLDEPTMGLRNESRRSLINHLKSDRDEKKMKHVFVASQDTKFVNEVCDMVLDISADKFELADLDNAKKPRKAVAS